MLRAESRGERAAHNSYKLPAHRLAHTALLRRVTAGDPYLHIRCISMLPSPRNCYNCQLQRSSSTGPLAPLYILTLLCGHVSQTYQGGYSQCIMHYSCCPVLGHFSAQLEQFGMMHEKCRHLQSLNPFHPLDTFIQDQQLVLKDHKSVCFVLFK